MQKITLQELLSALLDGEVSEIDTSALGVISEHEKVLRRHMDVYRKRVVETSEAALDEFFTQCRTPGCEHHEHRTWPVSADDDLALANLLVYLSSLYMDAAKRLGKDAFEAGRAIEQGEPPPSNYATEALFAVVSSAMITATMMYRDSVADGKALNALKFFVDFEAKTRKTIAEHSETLLTGKTPSGKGTSRGQCH